MHSSPQKRKAQVSEHSNEQYIQASKRSKARHFKRHKANLYDAVAGRIGAKNMLPLLSDLSEQNGWTSRSLSPTIRSLQNDIDDTPRNPLALTPEEALYRHRAIKKRYKTFEEFERAYLDAGTLPSLDTTDKPLISETAASLNPHDDEDDDDDGGASAESPEPPIPSPVVVELPDSDLVKAIHTYASRFYATTSPDGGVADWRSFDASALLAFGILMEEQCRFLAGGLTSRGDDGVSHRDQTPIGSNGERREVIGDHHRGTSGEGVKWTYVFGKRVRDVIAESESDFETEEDEDDAAEMEHDSDDSQESQHEMIDVYSESEPSGNEYRQRSRSRSRARSRSRSRSKSNAEPLSSSSKSRLKPTPNSTIDDST